MLARINDANKIQKVIHLLVGNFIADIFIALCIIMGVAWVSLKIALVVSLVIALMTGVLWKYQQAIQRGHQRVMSAFALREKMLLETFNNLHEIKMHNSTGDFLRRGTRSQDLFQDQILRLGNVNLRCGFWSEALAALLLILPMYLGIMLISENQLQLGEWVALLFLISGLTPALSRSVLFNTYLKEAKVALNRLYEIRGLPDEPQYTQPLMREVVKEIRISHLFFAYPGQKLLLEGLNMHLQRGTICAINGKSGCGKSTLLYLLQRMYQPVCGEIKVQGLDLQQWPLHDWRNRISLVSQTIKLFQTSLAKNISMELWEDHHQQVQRFCRNLGFEEQFNWFKGDYRQLIGAGGFQLSGGEAQMVAWARALYRQPQVLLLDEATTYLDQQKKAFVMDLLQKLKHSMVILMVSHDPQILEQADKVFKM